MKSLLGILIFAVCSVSFAQSMPPTPPVFEKQTVSFVVSKNVIEKVNDQYVFSSVKVCAGSFSADAYDLRNFNHGTLVPDHTACEINHDGKVVGFTLSSLSGVQAGSEFGTGDYKFYHLGFWQRYTDGSPYPLPQTDFSSAGTPDIYAKNMMLWGRAEQYVTCKDKNKSKQTIKIMMNSPAPDDMICNIINPVAFSIAVHFETL